MGGSEETSILYKVAKLAREMYNSFDQISYGLDNEKAVIPSMEFDQRLPTLRNMMDFINETYFSNGLFGYSNYKPSVPESEIAFRLSIYINRLIDQSKAIGGKWNKEISLSGAWHNHFPDARTDKLMEMKRAVEEVPLPDIIGIQSEYGTRAPNAWMKEFSNII